METDLLNRELEIFYIVSTNNVQANPTPEP